MGDNELEQRQMEGENCERCGEVVEDSYFAFCYACQKKISEETREYEQEQLAEQQGLVEEQEDLEQYKKDIDEAT